MSVSEKQLKELMLHVLSGLEMEKRAECTKDSKQALYILCISLWGERYVGFLKKMEGSDTYDTVPVVPPPWKNVGYGARLRQPVSFGKILYRSDKVPDNLDRVITLLPIVLRDVLVKTALCISNIYETPWIAEYIKQGSQIILPLTGPEKSSGDEKPAYRKRIIECYGQVLEFGAEVCSTKEFSSRAPYEIPCEGTDRMMAYRTEGSTCTSKPNKKRKRIISSSNVEQFVSNGVIYLQPGGIVTDLAKDRTKFLEIVFE